MTDNTVIPNNFQPLYSSADVQGAVSRIGKEINSWAASVWKASHTDLLAIPILRGGMFLFTDLVREVSHSVEVAPARTWAYEAGQNAILKKSVDVNIKEVPARGRAILLVDDICDSGKTLKALCEALMKEGAQTVKAAVLVRRQVENQEYKPEWVGFDYKGPEWLVGYGMDDCDRWRNLPGIYVIKQG